MPRLLLISVKSSFSEAGIASINALMLAPVGSGVFASLKGILSGRSGFWWLLLIPCLLFAAVLIFNLYDLLSGRSARRSRLEAAQRIVDDPDEKYDDAYKDIVSMQVLGKSRNQEDD